MRTEATIQRFTAGIWHDIASVALADTPTRGIGSPTHTAYTLDYAIAELGRRDAAALSWCMPVRLDALSRRRWPAFLVDLLPQGYGRLELLRRLQLPSTVREEAHWPLLLAGAGNPIGHLRIREAYEWLSTESNGVEPRGFTAAQIAARSDDFTEFLTSHGLFAAGSSGVQGEWPKILLTEAKDGLFYLDHTLPDNAATRHWLVKFGQGTDPLLAKILAMEAPYMRIAQRLGLRVHGELKLLERSLFIPRFDRKVTAQGVKRIAQESLACLCDIADFGISPLHTEALAQVAQAVTHPEREVLEYVKRDISNVALGNRDNHARNTALNRHEDGTIELTPVFDFAPMLLHPDSIARTMRWARDDQGSPRWASVIEQCREATGLPLSSLPHALKEFGETLAQLQDIARAEGVDGGILGRQHTVIEEAARQLARL
jgi:serine/threonine-protein kinase HipA